MKKNKRKEQLTGMRIYLIRWQMESVKQEDMWKNQIRCWSSLEWKYQGLNTWGIENEKENQEMPSGWH